MKLVSEYAATIGSASSNDSTVREVETYISRTKAGNRVDALYDESYQVTDYNFTYTHMFGKTGMLIFKDIHPGDLYIYNRSYVFELGEEADVDDDFRVSCSVHFYVAEDYEKIHHYIAIYSHQESSRWINFYQVNNYEDVDPTDFTQIGHLTLEDSDNKDTRQSLRALMRIRIIHFAETYSPILDYTLVKTERKKLEELVNKQQEYEENYATIGAIAETLIEMYKEIKTELNHVKTYIQRANTAGSHIVDVAERASSLVASVSLDITKVRERTDSIKTAVKSAKNNADDVIDNLNDVIQDNRNGIQTTRTRASEVREDLKTLRTSIQNFKKDSSIYDSDTKLYTLSQDNIDDIISSINSARNHMKTHFTDADGSLDKLDKIIDKYDAKVEIIDKKIDNFNSAITQFEQDHDDLINLKKPISDAKNAFIEEYNDETLETYRKKFKDSYDSLKSLESELSKKDKLLVNNDKELSELKAAWTKTKEEMKRIMDEKYSHKINPAN